MWGANFQNWGLHPIVANAWGFLDHTTEPQSSLNPKSTVLIAYLVAERRLRQQIFTWSEQEQEKERLKHTISEKKGDRLN